MKLGETRRNAGEHDGAIRAYRRLLMLEPSRKVGHAALLQAVALRDEIVPIAEQAHAGTQEGYRQGKFGYLEVLDTQDTIIAMQARLLDAQARTHRAAAILESLIGAGLETLPAPTEEQP